MSDHDHIYSTKLQDKIERNTLLMFIFTAIAVAIGGIVEIVPLFYLPNTGMSGGDGYVQQHSAQRQEWQRHSDGQDRLESSNIRTQDHG